MKNRKRLEKIENRKNREKARLLHDRLIKLDSLYYTNDGRLTLAEREEYDKLKNESKEVLNKIPKEKKEFKKLMNTAVISTIILVLTSIIMLTLYNVLGAESVFLNITSIIFVLNFPVWLISVMGGGSFGD